MYIGFTKDLKKRVSEHNAGQTVSTKPYMPWSLVFYEAYANRDDASRREMYLKTTQGRRAIRNMLKSHLMEYKNKPFEYQGSTTG